MDKSIVKQFASQSNLDHFPGWVSDGQGLENLLVFTKAVVAYEREACAKICDERHYTWRFGDGADSVSGPKECAAEIRNRTD